MSRVSALACSVLAAAAFSAFAAAPAHADPGICIDHVMESGFPATESVIKACKIAKTGRAEDVRTCRRMLAEGGVPAAVTQKACRIASYPDPVS
ncbi:hypothetical protein ACFFQW_01540 [Umezawaea endophytica]|uniref:Cysteine rich repeat protein n=1 Tax=Umezawaea endophytica TaxID=1654476 RepID=A0A9X2VHU9_9PSEU|nr:hypothetical protein [Umezawaea endophytica]MCS7476935.1 hypothetical protein [Umezawaea endophytica]